jgi:hypothetical protein
MREISKVSIRSRSVKTAEIPGLENLGAAIHQELFLKVAI